MYYCFTESGYLQSDIWSKVLAKFSSIWQQRHGDLVSTLLLDNLAIHRTFEPLLDALSKSVRVQFLPPNTSHFLQPLDDKVFAIYKSVLAQLAQRLAAALRSNGEKATAREIITAASSFAVAAAFKPSVIVESFANCHLWPFDADKIQEAAEVNTGQVIVLKSPKSGPKYDSKTIQLKVAAIYAKKAERDRSLISGSKTKNRRVGMTVKYGQLSSVEQVIKTNQEKEEAEAEAAEAAHDALLSKMVEAELKLRAKEEKAEAAALKRELKAAEAEAKRIANLAIAEAKLDKANAKPAPRGRKRKRQDKDAEESSEDPSSYLCNVMKCESKWNGASDWHWCDHCLTYGICSHHWETNRGNGKELLLDHERRCGVRAKKPRKK